MLYYMGRPKHDSGEEICPSPGVPLFRILCHMTAKATYVCHDISSLYLRSFNLKNIISPLLRFPLILPHVLCYNPISLWFSICLFCFMFNFSSRLSLCIFLFSLFLCSSFSSLFCTYYSSDFLWPQILLFFFIWVSISSTLLILGRKPLLRSYPSLSLSRST